MKRLAKRGVWSPPYNGYNGELLLVAINGKGNLVAEAKLLNPAYRRVTEAFLLHYLDKCDPPSRMLQAI